MPRKKKAARAFKKVAVKEPKKPAVKVVCRPVQLTSVPKSSLR